MLKGLSIRSLKHFLWKFRNDTKDFKPTFVTGEILDSCVITNE